MKYLGVEFYRNFVGIEKPLKIEIPHEDGGYTDSCLSYCTVDYLYSTEISDEFDYNECRPYLRTIEDLSDEELLYFYYGDSIPESAIVKRINGVVQLIHFGYEDEYGEVTYTHKTCDIKKCDNDQFNRLSSMHCHLKAKEYIDNGFALSYKDLVE